jgi:membrane peptidoglycan carboxypeptidase
VGAGFSSLQSIAEIRPDYIKIDMSLVRGIHKDRVKMALMETFVTFSEKMGITTFTDPSKYGLSLTLGGGEVRPYDMATAYGVFANQGIKQDLVSILKVEDWKGNVLEETKINDIKLSGDRILEPDTTFLISHILQDNNARSGAFGPSSYLNVKGHSEVSVKTGTTNDRRDNWTIGYTPYALTLTWVGNNDNGAMSGAVSGISGASPIWNTIMRQVLDKAEKGFYDKNDSGHAWIKQSQGIAGSNVCVTTGNVPVNSEAGCQTRFEYFLKDKIGAGIDSGQKDVQLDKITHALAAQGTPPDQTDTQNHPYLTDPLGTLVCLDCPIASASATIKYPLTGSGN